jgi:hypothetical protein
MTSHTWRLPCGPPGSSANVFSLAGLVRSSVISEDAT